MEAHDIVRFNQAAYLDIDWPDWFEPTAEPVFATVRRDSLKEGLLPVGLRGKQRNQRFAFELAVELVADVIHPWSLIGKNSFRHAEILNFPAYQAYLQARILLQGTKWGVGGSLGFELATDQPTVKKTSDFDVLLYAKEPAELPLKVIQQHPEFFQPLDVQVITAKGGFALKEYLQHPDKKILLKTINGPILTNELW
ncbi:malonate decarboxylase holo-ACP synthase [Erwinia sp. CPCC 100877]|nr:malonate decarboxylase holo-ACP synthase [Erwinia sp. CPCC 100877]